MILVVMLIYYFSKYILQWFELIVGFISSYSSFRYDDYILRLTSSIYCYYDTSDFNSVSTTYPIGSNVNIL